MTSLLEDESGSTTADVRRWICCQLGAREHYSIPRGLHQRGLLAGLVTEAWVPPNNVMARIGGEVGKHLRERYDEELADANVRHALASSIVYELFAKISKPRNNWDSIIARNNWFQAKAVRHLSAIAQHGDQKSRPVVFAYSYAAQRIFRTARELGCTMVLGQIDPGPMEERIVSEICLRRGHRMDSAQRIPEPYWDSWREECEVCDGIIVNSQWTREALIAEGVPPDKMYVVPVAYDPPRQASQFNRIYPAAFDVSRPLRVLFLGSLIPRKGIYELIEAASQLKTMPVEFHLVGALPADLSVKSVENVYWTEAVARTQVHDFYRFADIFILPTHSDGFGLTQLEAMAWGLPVIASENCGDVVAHEINGLVLREVDAKTIIESIGWCVENAKQLKEMSYNAQRTTSAYHTSHVISQLLQSAANYPAASR